MTRPTIDRTKQYQCAECAGIFDYGWTNEEARAEQESNGWSDIPDELMAVICDDCYKAMFVGEGGVNVIESSPK